MATGEQTPSSASLRSVTRVLDVLDALQEAPGGLPLRDIARASGMAKSTTLRYLAALDERRYVERDPNTGEYRLGLGVPSQTAIHARIREKVRPALERLRDRFDETITFSVLDGDRITQVEGVESRQAVRLHSENGARFEFNCTAAGKVIAAMLPEAFVDRLIKKRGLPERTPHTITEPTRMLEELALVRKRGYADTHEEDALGTSAVAVPVPLAKPHAALGYSAPTMRFRDDDVPAIVEALRSEASRVAAELEAWHG
jgi:IclR family transcriptional regulator, acetate operon repressor